MMFIALLILPDRAALVPIPDNLAAKYHLAPQRMPFSTGLVLDAWEGSYWAHCSLTDWRWVSDTIYDSFTGRTRVSGAAVFPGFPKKKLRCPYNPRVPGCDYNSCSDNTHCIEKPWVKQNIDQDFAGLKATGSPPVKRRRGRRKTA